MVPQIDSCKKSKWVSNHFNMSHDFSLSHCSSMRIPKASLLRSGAKECLTPAVEISVFGRIWKPSHPPEQRSQIPRSTGSSFKMRANNRQRLVQSIKFDKGIRPSFGSIRSVKCLSLSYGALNFALPPKSGNNHYFCLCFACLPLPAVRLADARLR